MTGRTMAALLALLAAACSSSNAEVTTAPTATPEAGPEPIGPEVQHAKVTVTVESTRFVTREHFLAGGEMQVSGEPFAQAMGRDLGGYARNALPTDLYVDPSPLARAPWIDLPGFSTAIESYEYSKQPMNDVALESGAGTSLAYGPLVNPAGASGADATALLADQIQHFATGSNAVVRWVFAPGSYPVDNTRGGNANPTGTGKPEDNPLGWPGLWPTAHAFKSFDPTVNPSSDVALFCSITSDDNPGAHGQFFTPDYECDATSLHLPNRSAQIEPVLTPGADGFSAWKYGLWTLNYLQIMHDSGEAPVDTITSGTPSAVGMPGNLVKGTPGGRPAPGTYLGSSNIEGFQAQIFISSIDNRAEDWLLHFATSDGVNLQGFATLSDALAYDHTAPLRWFPGSIAVSESDDGGAFPKPSYTLTSADSDLLDQLGLVLGYSELYALTDTNNADVGGSTAASVYFDGDPFPADDQLADGEATPHDRALAMLRVATVNLDRMHRDPASGLLVDGVQLQNGAPVRGSTASTTVAAYAVLALRSELRALSSQLELYSNNTTDSAIVGNPLDALPLGLTGDPSSFTERTELLLRSEAELLLNQLTDADGQAYAGWDLSANAPLSTDDLLDSHTAAVRGLFAAYLATGDVRYRARALAVFDRLERVFYDSDARLYAATPAPADTVEYTPLRFALLQSALRDMYELVAARSGGEELAPVLEARVARLNKLVLNGWDDRNQDRMVEWPDECMNVVDGLPRGGLQMAERTLTGESGSEGDQMINPHPDLDAGMPNRVPSSDREHDCVPEIDDAHLPSALADRITLHVARQ